MGSEAAARAEAFHADQANDEHQHQDTEPLPRAHAENGIHCGVPVLFDCPHWIDYRIRVSFPCASLGQNWTKRGHSGRNSLEKTAADDSLPGAIRPILAEFPRFLVVPMKGPSP